MRMSAAWDWGAVTVPLYLSSVAKRHGGTGWDIVKQGEGRGPLCSGSATFAEILI
jgi:hypothetical protein